MPDYLIYGKIIIDDIRLADGPIARNLLGGGGPQAAFGARLWHDSIGFLSRSGTDIESKHRQTLQGLDIDLGGWHQYEDIATTRNMLMDYDENEYLVSRAGDTMVMATSRADWDRLLAQVLTLPSTYANPKAVHLVTEFFDEPMVHAALALRDQGAIFSLEPIIDFRHWRNRESLLALLPQIDIVTPDWPSASGLAGSDDPRQVMAYWSTLGPTVVAVRHGHHGSYIWSQLEDQIWHIPIIPVEVVDPTGAGNSYGGGLSVGWTESQDARTAGSYGAISAKFVVETAGFPANPAELRPAAQRLLEQVITSTRPL